MKKTSFFDIILLILSAALCFGTAFLFHPCGPKDDGSWMLCHWAGRAVVTSGAAFLAASVARFFVGKGLKSGISLAFIPFSVVTLLFPKTIIRICMMKDMRCHTVTRPAVIIICALIAITSLFDLIRLSKAERE